MYTKALAAVAAILATTSASPVPRQTTTNKKGICFNDASAANSFVPGAVWAMNWASSVDKIAPGLEFVPILKPGEEASWDSNVETVLGTDGEHHLLGPNEPDKPSDPGVGGTDMAPSDAAKLYKNGGLLAKYAGRAKIGAPGISAAGMWWLQQFADACKSDPADPCQFVSSIHHISRPIAHHTLLGLPSHSFLRQPRRSPRCADTVRQHEGIP